MIWLCVFPTLTALNLTLSDWLAPDVPSAADLVLATVAVPIVIYGLMPYLHRARIQLGGRSGRAARHERARGGNHVLHVAGPGGLTQH